MREITKELLSELKNTNDIEAFFKTYENQFIDIRPCDYLNELAESKGVSIAHTARNSGSGEYVYKVFKGERNPSRDVLIKISFGMGLSVDEAQLLLRISKFAILDSRDKRDGVFIYALSHGMSVFEANDILEEKGLITLA